MAPRLTCRFGQSQDGCHRHPATPQEPPGGLGSASVSGGRLPLASTAPFDGVPWTLLDDQRGDIAMSPLWKHPRADLL